MTYSPKHNDKSLRTIYMTMFFASVVAIMINGIRNDKFNWLYISIAMLCLVGFLFLLISFELTTYSYVLNAKKQSFDFFVDRAVGKRNGYICYYPLADLVYLVKKEESTKERLSEHYKKIRFNRYVHNIFSKECYVLVFKNSSYYDAIIIEANESYLAYLNNAIKLQKIELDVIENKKEQENEASN